MKARRRHIKNLYHRWGIHHGLEPQEVAEALSEAGLIVLLDEDCYREVPNDIPTAKFPYTIATILTEYKKKIS